MVYKMEAIVIVEMSLDVTVGQQKTNAINLVYFTRAKCVVAITETASIEYNY